MQIIHVLRLDETTNWQDMTIEKFLRQDISHTGIADYKRTLHDMLPFITAWNEVFKLTYFQFRTRLKNITDTNILKLKADRYIRINQIEQHLDDNCYFLFSDDDDWYNPALGDVLRRSGSDVLTWDDVRFRFATTLLPRVGNIFYTNNWALSDSILKKVPSSDRRKLNHFTATQMFTKQPLGSFTRSHLHECYSIANKTIASLTNKFTFFNGADRKQRLLEARDQYAKAKIPAIIKEAAWAEEEIWATRKLMNELFGL